MSRTIKAMVYIPGIKIRRVDDIYVMDFEKGGCSPCDIVHQIMIGRIAELEGALERAIEGWEDCANYKSDYLREKHGDAEGIEEAKLALRDNEST